MKWHKWILRNAWIVLLTTILALCVENYTTIEKSVKNYTYFCEINLFAQTVINF
jgi:hypothetical protein